MEEKEVIKKEWKKFFLLLSFVSVFLLCFFILLIHDKKPDNIEEPQKTFSIKNTKYGFIYYNGDIYYKHPNMIIYDLLQVGDCVGENEKHIKVNDIVNNEVVFDDENLCIFAEILGTKVFSYKGNENALLIHSDYAINSYFVYIKDVTAEEEANKTLSYYIQNPEKADSVMIISYGMNTIDIDFQLSSLEQIDSNVQIPSSNIQNGKMIYYLLIEENGIYYSFRGEGNILSNMIIFESTENGKNINYLLKYDKLSEKLLEMYSDFFDITIQEDIKTKAIAFPTDEQEVDSEKTNNLYQKQTNLLPFSE